MPSAEADGEIQYCPSDEKSEPERCRPGSEEWRIE